MLARIVWGMPIEEVLIFIVVVAAAIGVVYVVLSVFGVTVPPWFVKILLIIAAAFVGIVAIRLLFAM